MSIAIQGGTDDFDFIRQFIRERSAIVLDRDKDYLVEARLAPLAEQKGYTSIRELFQALRQAPLNSSLAKEVVEAMTTNETSFFRDMAPFECLSSIIIPDLMDRRENTKQLNIWSGACSSGQEAYSILLLLNEILPQDTWKIHLLATDINSAMVARAKLGKYSQLEISRGLPTHMLVENFHQDGVMWQVSQKLRNLVTVREFNLIAKWPLVESKDVIFLRNVLIYFDVETKRAILQQIKRVLEPDGYLFLGGAETTIGVDEDFERVDYPKASCYRLRSV
ncbi:MAG: protein-glutamate O-methyltransferase CheR [Myxococcales bacterium]|nr:protein-glutamate O-methyltransferase CheR [Myxococcales bacterium]